MDGIETGRRIKKGSGTRGVPTVVMVTAYGREEVMRQAEDAGLDGFLIKPVSPSVLLNTILEVLGHGERRPFRPLAGLATHPSALASIQGARLLVAEDNEINQQIILEILEHQGFEVIIATNGKKCVEAYQKEKDIDLILMDVQMPEMDGIEATQFIRERLGDEKIKIIALTADAINETRERIKNSGMNDFISKPIDESELFRAMVRWIDAEAIKKPLAGLPETKQDFSGEASRPAHSDTPEISYSEGIRRVKGNEKLYRDLVKKFIDANAELTAELKKNINKNEYTAMAGRAHNFKGVAANLGLKKIAVLAAELQAAAEQKSPGASGLVERLENELAAAFTELKNYLGVDAAAEKEMDELEFLNELSHMLDTDEMRGRDYFADGREKFCAGRMDEYNALAAAMDIYDFETAKKELNILIERKTKER